MGYVVGLKIFSPNLLTLNNTPAGRQGLPNLNPNPKTIFMGRDVVPVIMDYYAKQGLSFHYRCLSSTIS
jgi:hypothetical protein